MVNLKSRRKIRNVLSPGQNRLLKESLKLLIGQGLIYSPSQRSERQQKENFLKEALNAKFLDSEWFT